MLMTKEQAAATWCPMVKQAREQVTGAGGCDNHQCIADKCAAWRWGEFNVGTELKVVEVVVAHVGRQPTRENRVEQVPTKVPVAGYCGLAGRPA